MLDFLKFDSFDNSCGEPVCVTVQNFIKIRQTVLERLQVFDFQDCSRSPSCISNF